MPASRKTIGGGVAHRRVGRDGHFVALLLATIGILLCLPSVAMAETISDVTYLDENGATQTCASAEAVATDDDAWTTGWYVVDGAVSIDQTVSVDGDVSLILKDGAALTIDCASGPGIAVGAGDALTVYSQSSGTSRGQLTAGSTQDKTPGIDVEGGSFTAVGSSIKTGYIAVSDQGTFSALAGSDIVVSGRETNYQAVSFVGSTFVVDDSSVTATPAGVDSFGTMSGFNGTLIVGGENSSVRATGHGVAIEAKVIEISGGYVSALAEECEVSGAAVKCDDMTISGGEFEITAEGVNAYGLSDYTGTGYVKVEGGALEVAADGKRSAVGIHGQSSVHVAVSGGEASFAADSDCSDQSVTTNPANGLAIGADIASLEVSGGKVACSASTSKAECNAWGLRVFDIHAYLEGGEVWNLCGGELVIRGTEYATDTIPTFADGVRYEVMAGSTPDGANAQRIENYLNLTPDDWEAYKYVSIKPSGYPITVSAGEGGTASASTGYAAPGVTVTLSATPADGYHLKEWKVSPDSLQISDKGTFTMPASAVTAEAVFEKHVAGVDDGDCTTPVKCSVCSAELVAAQQSHQFGASVSNQNGTHTAACTHDDCKVSQTSDCSYDESGACTSCGYKRLSIVAQPVDAAGSYGGSASFAVEAAGDAADVATYQWQQSAGDGTTWQDVEELTGATITVSPLTMEMDGHRYRCVISVAKDSVTSEGATLSVEKAAQDAPAAPKAKEIGLSSVVLEAIAPNENGVAAEFGISKDGGKTWEWQDSAEFDGLSAGTSYLFVARYAETGNYAASEPSEATSVRTSYPYVPPTPSGPDWDDVMDDIASADSGDRVVVDMDGETVLPGEVLEALAGRDVTLVLEMEDGVAWEIQGADVPEETSFSDTDMGAELGTDGIPVDVTNLVTGESGVVQVTLAHEGPFGFELTLTAPLGEKNDGLYANLYCYDEDAGMLEFEAWGVVEGGVARLRLDHASQWAIALDDRSHALPFSDAFEGQWYSETVRWAWLSDVMTGYAGTDLFGPDDDLTRAQMAAVLYNLAGQPEAVVSDLPEDCDPSAWYAAVVSWALETGAFNGYGDGSTFGPDDPLTREQAACVLYNAAQARGEDVSARADLAAFPDAYEVSDWASEALSWAVDEGVLNGVELPDGTRELAPLRTCTRAEMAALMMNLSTRD